jgi:hypothetical protein
MSDSVYEICPVCKNHYTGRGGCHACDGNGFIRTGLTTAQVEAHAEDAKRIQKLHALGFSLLAPPGRDKSLGWLCTGRWRGETEKFRGDDPRKAIDAATRGLGL